MNVKRARSEVLPAAAEVMFQVYEEQRIAGLASG
jgi:hypothetical protein